MATRAKELSDLGNSGHLNVHDDGTVTLEGGNVGIGDPTPTEGKLVVRGDANINGLFVGGNSTTGQSYGALINAGTNSSDANFRLYDQSGSTPYLFVRGDGNVSINTSTPDVFNFRIATDSILSGSDYSWPFDITRAGQTNSRGFSIGQQTGSGVTALGNHNGDLALGHTYGADSNGQPIFYETMRIKHIDQDVGRVGIGITTPTVKLDVRSSEDPSDGTIVFLRNEVASGNGAFIRYDVNNVGDWAIGIPDNRNAFTIWKDSGNTGTEYFTVNSVGNVGIGTSSPAALLHINGSGDAVRVTSTNSGSGGAQVDLIQYTTSPADNDIHGMINFGGYTSGTSAAYGSSIRSVWSDVSAKEGQLEFFTRDDAEFAARMIINKDGNVGIGTTNPSEKLHVQGDGADILLTDAAGGQMAKLGSSGSNNGLLELFNSSHNRTILLNSNGDSTFASKVAIGTGVAHKLLQVKESSTSTTSVHYPITVGGSNHVAGYAAGIGFDPEGYGNRNKMAIVAEGINQGWSRGKFHFLLHSSSNTNEATLANSKMTIQEDGNVGIGTTSPQQLLHIHNSNGAFGAEAVLTGRLSTGTPKAEVAFKRGTSGDGAMLVLRPSNSSGSLTDVVTIKDNEVNTNQRFNVTINQNANFVAKFINNGGGGYGIGMDMAAGNHFFFYRSGSGTGSITDNGSNVSYNTSSDYRLKEDIVDLVGAVDRLKQLQPRRFKFIGNDKLGIIDGFIAHEVQAVIPDAVDGKKDAVDVDGNIVPQAIDQSRLVPLLTAALQEALIKIEQLEARMNILEE